MNLSVEEFLELRSALPLIDVRSPSEFKEGHIPGALCIPLLNDQERIEVGTDYKKKGQKEAIMTGFRLVGPRLHDIIEEAEKSSQGKEMLVHCWRGGMRSNSFSQFVAMAGIKSHTLLGGYKAYRQKALDYFRKPLKIVLLAGYTGSGKTEILRELKEQGEQVLDLELLANHKGSVFGGLMMPPQPTTEQFQNELFENIRQLDLDKPIWVEDESIAIGKIFLPDHFWYNMTQSPLLRMDVPKEIRVQRLVMEYGSADKKEFLELMSKVIKKLGGQNFNAARDKLVAGDMAGVIEILLTYYDKAYLNSMDKRTNRLKQSLTWNGKDPSEVAKKIIQDKKQLFND